MLHKSRRVIKEEHKIVIIGAGLTGLALAYQLKKIEVPALLIEARDRIGGRILTKYDDQNASIELGATWLGRKHVSLIALLRELGIEIHEQLLGDLAVYEPISTSPPQIVRLPPNEDPSFRIKGGTSTLIASLRAALSESQVILNHPVEEIREKDDVLIVKTKEREIHAEMVISTLPPYLLARSLKFEPALPESFQSIAHRTHTWMGESIKVGLTYAQPFWKEKGTSGTVFSSVGPVGEMYDHSNYENSRFALKGFLNGAYHSTTREHRIEIIMEQLSKYYGEQVRDYTSYEEGVWSHEPYTFLKYEDSILPHQNNGHAIYRWPLINGKLYVAGAETADAHPGYMDGAVRSAMSIFENLRDRL